jgi:mono/diheme cytochrome c family protein
MRFTLLMVLSAALFLPACEEDDEGGNVDPARIDTILGLAGDANAGQAVFARCSASTCHGTDGNSGSSGSPLSSEVPELSDEGVIDVVLGGVEDMPAQSLTDQEMADLLEYLRQTFG